MPGPGKEAMEEFERSIESAKSPGNPRGIFDDLVD
jgi:hypothetical protein